MRDSSLSRRRFLQSAGAAAVAVPTSNKGFTAAEMRGLDATDVMEADISKWELDTPALCVDLDALEALFETPPSPMPIVPLSDDEKLALGVYLLSGAHEADD